MTAQRGNGFVDRINRSLYLYTEIFTLTNLMPLRMLRNIIEKLFLSKAQCVVFDEYVTTS